MFVISSQKQNTATKVWELATPIAKDLGLDIWDVRYLKEGASYFLRIFIDKPGGVDLNDCENLSRAIDEPLDEHDFIKDAYFLEVSSPGLERELTRPEHFSAFMGESVKVSLYKAFDGNKTIIGVLSEYSDSALTLEVDGQTVSFARSEISKVNVNDLDI